MVRFTRLGVVLRPETSEPRTVAKFNAGAVLDGDVVHMVYRYAVWRPSFDPETQSNYAIDDTRYARLSPEGELLFEAKEPLLSPSLAWDYSGCQDARIVPFEGAYYLTYCGWDKDVASAGHDRGRVGFARTKDFVRAEKLGFVNHYAWDKDAFLFPERIAGKVAYVHRVPPNIQIDYFDSVEELLEPTSWIDYEDRVEQSTVVRAAFAWESGKVGGSVPPIKTDDGWLLIYHAVQPTPRFRQPNVYRTGVALLSLANPSRVVARLPYPVLEPEEDYEIYGDVENVVFPVGGYIFNDDLYITYGGADRCVAMAKTPVARLLDELRKHPV
jgi:predicted GH43/DUF377 family glycosyl hydrolase